MPYLSLKTNVKISPEKKAVLVRELGAAIAVIGKREAHFMLQIEDETALYFAGTGAPAAIAEFALLGKAAQGYAELSELFTGIISEATGVEPSRIFVKINELENWALGGQIL